MKFWLMKSEPDTFSIDHLKSCKKSTSPWDGVRNYQARNFMRDEMKENDLVLFYHSSCKDPGVAGVAKITKESYPDFTQFDKKSKYYDEKATKEKPRWFLVDVTYVEKFSDVITLKELKEVRALEEMKLLQKGSRLSIQPVTKKEFKQILKMAGSSTKIS